MRKLTGGLIVMAFLLCAFTAQAVAGIDVSVPSAGEECSDTFDCGQDEECIANICIPSAGEPCSNDLDCLLGGECVNDVCVPSVGDSCSNDLDCGDGFCVNDICVPSVGEPCTNDLQCGPGELCIDDICQEGECETSEDCEEGLLCDNSTYQCVECLASSDCPDGEFCVDNNTCVTGGDCDLRIKPRRININKNKSPEFVWKKLKINGNENFDAKGAIVADTIVTGVPQIRTKRNNVNVVVKVSSDLELGFYPIRVGNCIGEIELYDKKAEKAAKKAAQ